MHTVAAYMWLKIIEGTSFFPAYMLRHCATDCQGENNRVNSPDNECGGDDLNCAQL